MDEETRLEEKLRIADEGRAISAGFRAMAHLAAHAGAVDRVEGAPVRGQSVAGDVRAWRVTAQTPLPDTKHILVGHCQRRLEQWVTDGVAHHGRHPSVVGHVELPSVGVAGFA